jgi:hypothetical protein
MTSLAAWVAVDSRGETAAYLASDSRVSWGPNQKWDTGRKVFACQRHPDLFGYCGDVVFPSKILGKIVEFADLGALFDPTDTAADKFSRVVTMVKNSFNDYPANVPLPFTMVHWSRQNSGVPSDFELRTLSWNRADGWREESIKLPQGSTLALTLGSGKNAVEKSYQRWKESSSGGTSRAVFSAFCDALASESDPLSGGAPQLVGVYRQGFGRAFGVVWKGTAYLYGEPASLLSDPTTLEWRNELFERCDPATLRRLPSAQPQPRPRFTD